MSASDLLLGGMIGSRNQKMVTDAAIDRAEHAENLLRKTVISNSSPRQSPAASARSGYTECL